MGDIRSAASAAPASASAHAGLIAALPSAEPVHRVRGLAPRRRTYLAVVPSGSDIEDRLETEWDPSSKA